MSNLTPVPMNRDQLADVFRYLADAVMEGDSFEGNVEYLMPEPDQPVPWPDFMVRATFRTGNTMGQGGVTMIGTIPEGQ